MTRPLTEIKRRPVEEVVGKLKDTSEGTSKDAGKRLVKDAAEFGLDLRGYLQLAVNGHDGLDGYEAAIAFLNLPSHNDFNAGVVLQAASETFQTYPGTRAMFPEVMDDMLRWANRQDQFESVAPFLSNSRTISGNEMVSTVVNDDSNDRASFSVPESGRIPVRTIRTSETAVKIYKHGSGIRTTYEFNRRASLDVLTPYVARIARELEISKTTAAYGVLKNGDGVHNAASSVNQSTYNTPTGTTATNGQINWQGFVYWLVLRAKAGVPVDTVIGNWDAAFQWAKMWGTSGSNTLSDAENAGRLLGQLQGQNGLRIPLPRFAVCSAAAANELLGITASETLEELKEAGSNITESERSIDNQTMTAYKTENSGYKLAFGDTRQVYNFGA